MACSMSNKQKRKDFCQKTSLPLFQPPLPLAKGWYAVAALSTQQAEWADRAPTGSNGAGIAAETPNCWQGITTQRAGARDICRERTDRPKVDRPPNRHLRTKVFHPPGELL